jgi:hypothetical protein
MSENIFNNPNVDLQAIQDAVCSAYVNGPFGADATQEEVDTIAQWVIDRYVAAQILDMVFTGLLDVGFDTKTNEPLFTNSARATAMVEKAENEAGVNKPSLKLVK